MTSWMPFCPPTTNCRDKRNEFFDIAGTDPLRGRGEAIRIDFVLANPRNVRTAMDSARKPFENHATVSPGQPGQGRHECSGRERPRDHDDHDDHDDRPFNLVVDPRAV